MGSLGVGAVAMIVMMGGMLLGGRWIGRKAVDHDNKTAEIAVCPVSGSHIAISSSAAQATVGGRVYYFDNEEHLRDFVLNPEKFPLDGAKKGARGQ